MRGPAIVNETFARRYLSHTSPTGHHITVPRYPSFEIVGVVRDAVSQSLRAAAPPSVYVPYFQYPEMIGIASFEIRVRGSVLHTTNSIRDELRTTFPTTPVQSQIQTLDDQVRRTLTQERMLAALGSCFGALALVLSAVGLSGLLFYTVARCTKEIGIRMALGATRAEVLGFVFRNACRLLASGIALGVPVAMASSRLIISNLFGLTPTDPLTLVGATTCIGVSTLLATLLPAIRASCIEPTVALRCE